MHRLMFSCVVFVLVQSLAVRGERLAAFDGPCIPGGCVAPPSNIPDILGRRALPAGRLARLGATPDFHHGLPGAQTPVKTIEDGALDKIELFVASLESPANLTVLIRTFDASAADLGTGDKGGKDARQQEAQTMKGEGPRVLAERFVATLEKGGPFKAVRVLKTDEAVPEGALAVEGKFVTIDPGSRAKRYFAGFGAGKSSVKVTGEVKDSAGRTLARFEQRRIGTMGMAGGDSLGKLMSDSRSIGEDIGKFLAKWARGDSLK